MHLPTSPSLMNTNHTGRRAHRQSFPTRHAGVRPGHQVPTFASTLPMEPPALPHLAYRPRRAPGAFDVVATYLVAYLVVFSVTLAVLLLTTDLTLAMDVVTLVARESLWFTPIVGTVLVIAPWRRALRQRPLASGKRGSQP